MYTDNETFAVDFRRALKTDDKKLASLLAHSLKGPSSNIGAVSIPQKAEQLYKLCRNNATTDDIEAQLQQVDSKLTIIINGLAQWLNQPPTKVPE